MMMRAKRFKKIVHKAMAWLLTAVLLLSYAERLGGGVIDVQAKETILVAQDVSEVNNKNILSISGGHAGVIKKDGSLWMWGNNFGGALGIENEEVDDEEGSHVEGIHLTPKYVMNHVKHVSCGLGNGNGTFAIKDDDSLWAWGYINGCTNGSYHPQKVMDGVKSAVTDTRHSAVIKKDGSLWVWGTNSYGCLGDGTADDRQEAVKIMDNVAKVTLGPGNSAAIKTDGSLWTWGDNAEWQLGDGTEKNSYKPIKIMDDVVDSYITSFNGAALKADGSLWAWGGSAYGNGTTGRVKIPSQIMDDVVAMSFTGLTGAAIKTDGSLWTWGYNSYGELGNGTMERSADPSKIMDNVVCISLDQNTGAAVKSDGSLWTWGSNDNGCLGNGTSYEEQPYVNVPIQIMPPGSISASGTIKTEIEIVDNPCVKVVDATGKPIADASVSYLEKTFSTSPKGTVTLDNYQQGKELVISKTGYATKTVPSFFRNKTGIITYVLAEESIYLTKEGEKIDLLTEQAALNTYYPNTKFSISYTSQQKHDRYMLYSGERQIKESTDGEFTDLRIGDFSIDEPVYLDMQDGNKKTVRKLNLHVVNDSPPPDVLHIGDEIAFTISDDFPLVGGQTLTIDIPDLPVEWSYKADGTMEGGIHFVKEEFDKVKGIEPKFQFTGYVEGNIKERDCFQGKLYVEVSLEYSKDIPLPPPVSFILIQLSIKGELNADGSIRWSVQDGVQGQTGVGGAFGLGLGIGAGVPDTASVGLYGEGEIGLHYVILPEDLRGLNELYVSGEAGARIKFLGEHKLTLVQGRYNIIGDGVSKLSDGQRNVFTLDDYEVYESIDRGYLQTDGTMTQWLADASIYADGNTSETALQEGAYFGTVSKVVCMGDTVMFFYLTDAGGVRDAADRDMLVYSLWDGQNWREPKAVLDDGTADYSPDLYTDGEKIYAVWQDAEESLKGLSVEESAKRFTLHAAVYDAERDVFTDLGKIAGENGLFQQNPQIAADGSGVSVYWHENAQDNVLGLSGTNRIYRASLTDRSVLTEGISVMSVSEKEDEESVSENTASAFRKFVALTEEPGAQETLTEDGSVSENTVPEDEEEKTDGEKDEGENKEPAEESPDKEDAASEEPEETVSDNTLPEEAVSENTVSGNTISENTVQVDTYGVVAQMEQAWSVTFLQEEGNCIFSADAGRMNGKTGYAYAAGSKDEFYNLVESRVCFLEQGKEAESIKNGKVEKVRFAQVYAGETLTWFEAGDIGYIDENEKAQTLLGESRIPSRIYTLLTDGTNPEVIFPINMGGKSNLYRISRENGAFTPALQVTEQDDYIQYADGFIKDGQTILVYNKMKVNDKLEEVENSLCTGTITHSYYDIAVQSAGSMVLYNEGTGEDELEITAQLYNNGTVKAENLNLSLCAPDGSVLGTVPVDAALEPGEAKEVSAVFSADLITQEAAYTVTVSGAEEATRENNSVTLTLGGGSLQVEAKMISVADTRTVQAGIRNTGVTACGGTVSVRDSGTGEEYYSGTFEPIEKGKTAVVEMKIAPALFRGKKELPLEVVVTPDREGVGAVWDLVKAYAPSYEVNFVTDAGTTAVYADYGTQISFPENPAKEGKQFIGWYDSEMPSNGTFYTEETVITKDLTLYACFADEERAQIPLAECAVSAIPMQFYTGGQIKPKVTVKWGSEVLKENKDYKLTYRNNKEQGKAAAVITAVTGNGKKYTGSIERSFTIMYPTSQVSVKAISAVNFTGDTHTPEPVVTYQKKTLVKGTDYTVSYFNNRNAGTAGVTITGKGTFFGTKTVTFQIRGTAISGMKFDKIPDVVYNGKNTKPIVTVKTKDGKTQLMSGSDYRLVYENTVNKGTATVTVIGNGNYTGTKKLTYKVVAKPLAESMVSVEQPSMTDAASLIVAPERAEYTYTGKPIKPALAVTDKAAGDTALVLNKDYTVSYSKNKAVGEAQITVKGKGNYSGTLKIPFTISPVNLAQAEAEGTVSVRVNDAAYTGKALKPAVQVYETVDGKERQLSGSAYTLFYINNTEKGTGTVTVTGKDKSGYTGTVTANFRIVDKAKLLTASSIKIDAISARIFTGSAVEPALHIVDKSDNTKEVTLEKGTHYEVTYKNNVNAGKATVTVRGIGSYAGSKTVSFKINKCAIADKNVLNAGFTVEAPKDMKYTGYTLKPDVVIKNKGVTLAQGKDYKLSYRNNTKIGTASVTVQGMGNYSGSYSAVNFRITAWDYHTLTAEVEDQTYMGKALKPQVTFYMAEGDGREEILLKPGTAVQITYKDNKDAGTATAVITGKGELKNITPITVTFEIGRANLREASVSRIPNQTLKGEAVKPVPKVKVGKNNLKAGRDFTVSYQRNGVKGEAVAIIRGVGNYTGECRKTFIVQ